MSVWKDCALRACCGILLLHLSRIDRVSYNLQRTMPSTLPSSLDCEDSHSISVALLDSTRHLELVSASTCLAVLDDELAQVCHTFYSQVGRCMMQR